MLWWPEQKQGWWRPRKGEILDIKTKNVYGQVKLRNWDQYREDQEKEKEIANCWTGWKDQNSELLRQEISNTSSTKLKNKEQCRATCTNTV